MGNWYDICESIGFISPEAAEMLMNAEISGESKVIATLYGFSPDETPAHRWAEVVQFLKDQGVSVKLVQE